MHVLRYHRIEPPLKFTDAAVINITVNIVLITSQLKGDNWCSRIKSCRNNKENFLQRFSSQNGMRPAKFLKLNQSLLVRCQTSKQQTQGVFVCV